MENTINFYTPTAIPLDAFTIMSASWKPGTNPIGRFGTGLKYAISIILRHGGKIRLFINGVEYEFYLHNKKFREKELETVRMRKRNGLGKWLSSMQLPFTTHLGYQWELWMAYRELYSNTIDESGHCFNGEADFDTSIGTLISVSCPGFAEAVEESEAFLDVSDWKMLVNTSDIKIYDKPSKYLYCEGIRVYTLRYPARFTYNFSNRIVALTEDRTIGNLWSVMYDLSYVIQRDVHDEELLKSIMVEPEEGVMDFESMELNFSNSTSSEEFRLAAAYLHNSGSVGRSTRVWWSEQEKTKKAGVDVSVSLKESVWKIVANAISFAMDHNGDLDDQEVDILDQAKHKILYG